MNCFEGLLCLQFKILEPFLTVLRVSGLHIPRHSSGSFATLATCRPKDRMNQEDVLKACADKTQDRTRAEADLGWANILGSAAQALLPTICYID